MPVVYNQQHIEYPKNTKTKRLMADDILQEKLFILMSAIQKADEQAFSEFYDLTVNRVYSLVYRILLNKDDSEEVVCDVYAQIWKQATNYYPERGSVLGWSLLIARCRALDLYRKNKNRNDIIQEAKDSLETFTDCGDEPDKIIQLFQENSQAKEAIKQLSLVQRQLLALAFFKGMSHSEISESIEMPLGSVKSNIRRALESLHNKLKD